VEDEDEDIDEEDLTLLDRTAGEQPLFVLPLYSLLSQERQNRWELLPHILGTSVLKVLITS
jgi:HrpA-like RNA helicase